jgi:hypothetical protein
MEAELSSVDVKEHSVHLVVRRFRAICPTCGPFVHDRVGHHGTISKKQMAQLFPNRERRRLRDALPEDERMRFKLTLAGKRAERWGSRTLARNSGSSKGAMTHRRSTRGVGHVERHVTYDVRGGSAENRPGAEGTLGKAEDSQAQENDLGGGTPADGGGAESAVG